MAVPASFLSGLCNNLMASLLHCGVSLDLEAGAIGMAKQGMEGTLDFSPPHPPPVLLLQGAPGLHQG